MSQQSSQPSRSQPWRAAPGPGHTMQLSWGSGEGAAGERLAGSEQLQAWTALVYAAAGGDATTAPAASPPAGWEEGLETNSPALP